MAESLSEFLVQLRGAPSSEQDGLEKLAQLEGWLATTPHGDDWAVLQATKGNLLTQMPGAGQGAYLEDAIACYQAALTFRTRENDPAVWASTLSNLSTAWRRRVFGDKAANREEARQYLIQALEVLEEGTRPWASAQANLGNAYFSRTVGDPRENQESTLHHFEQALTVFTRDDYPLLWSRLKSNSGLVHHERIAGSRSNNIETALALFEEALEVYDILSRNSDWAMIHNNFGAAYRNRRDGDPESNRRKAIEHYEHALEVWTREAFADDWARTQMNLGVAWREHTGASSLARARQHFLNALEVRTAERFPNEWIDTTHSLALMEAAVADWAALRHIAEEVLDRHETLLSSTDNIYERRRLVTAISAIRNLGVLAMTKQGDLAAAQQFHRKGKGRIFEHPNAGPGGRPLLRTTTASLLTDQVTLSFCILPLDEEPTLAFIECAESVPELIALPGLDRAFLQRLFEGTGGDEPHWIAGLEATREEHGFDTFERTIDHVGTELSATLAPLLAHLNTLPNTVNRLALAPSGPLALFPLGLLTFPDRSDTRLMDRFDITMASGDGAQSPTGPQSSGSRPRLLAIIDPRENLPFSREEGAVLEHLFEDKEILIGKQATKEAVLGELRNGHAYTIIHFACHGRFAWRHPEASYIELAAGEKLTMEEIRQTARLRPGALVVLSACETGITEYRALPDESYGLHTPFLAAGASQVLSTLWPVADHAASVLMRWFYAGLAKGKTAPQALRFAQFETASLSGKTARDDSVLRTVLPLRWTDTSGTVASEYPLAHPVYWAGFTVHGE